MRSVLLFTFLLFSKISISQNLCVDNQGNSYKTIKIGNQIWMAENLNVTTYNDGSPIDRQIGFDVGFGYDDIPGKYFSINKVFLYNWYAVEDPRGIAPKGFRIPTREDWEVLKNFIGEHNTEKLKSTKYGKVNHGNLIWPKPCPNCKNWTETQRIYNVCNVCDNKGFKGSIIIDLGESSKGSNSTGFNALKYPVLHNNSGYGVGKRDELNFRDAPQWWSSNESTGSSFEENRDAYAMQFLLHETISVLGQSKKSFFQIRCVADVNSTLSSSQVKSSGNTVHPRSPLKKEQSESHDLFIFQIKFPCLDPDKYHGVNFEYFKDPFYYFETESEVTEGKMNKWRITLEGGLWLYDTNNGWEFHTPNYQCD